MWRALVLVVLASSCGDVFSTRIFESSVTVSDQQKIVNEHNNYRLRIARGQLPNQPQGSNLYVMRWDNELAKTAQQVAETCIFAHKRVTDKRFPSVGQNLFRTTSNKAENGADWLIGIDKWFDEYKTYQYGNSSNNHYTQMVWANTYLIGCGYAHCDTAPNYTKIYVCHYGPGGNYVGKSPYKCGKGCTNLCAAPK